MADPREQLERVIQTAIDTSLKETHTALPAVVQSVDYENQLIEAQPTIQRKIDGVPTNLPLLVDVPLRFYKSSDFSITIPVREGDHVLIIFAERSIDTWLIADGIQDPNDIRRHSLSDGFAIPMMFSQEEKITSFDTKNIEIRTTNKDGFIALTPDGDVLLNGDGNSTISFAEMKSAFDQIVSDFSSHFHTTTATVGASSTPGVVSIPTVPSTADMSAAEVPTVKVP